MNEGSGLREDLVSILFDPASIAIIGMSNRPGSTGQSALSILEINAFKGDIHLVGRNGGTLGDRTVLTSVDDLPSGIDLAIIVLPASGVLDAIEGCVRRKVRTAVVFASGFAEMGDGEAQRRMSALAEQSGMGIVGPNCLGYTNYLTGLNIGFLGGTAIQKLPPDRRPAVAIVAQSGGLMASLSVAFSALRIPVAYRVSTGNEAGLALPDYLAYLAQDDAVSSIVMYAEQIRNPAAFIDAAKRVRAQGKTMVLMHTGRGEKARKAAASHTGAMAGEYNLMATALRRAGVLAVNTLEELLDCTELLARFPTPPVEGPALATTSGAFCAIAHDACEDAGLELPPLSPDTLQRARERMPDYVSPSNPLDVTTAVVPDPALMGDAGAILLDDPTMGSLTFAIPGIGPIGVKWLESIGETTRNSGKPVIISVLGDEGAWSDEFEALARETGAIISRSPERAIRTIACVTHYGRSLRKTPHALALEPFAKLPELGKGTQVEWRSKTLMRAIGIPTPPGGLARSREEAVSIASGIGYPVVLKVQASQLAHKTEIGGVMLGIADDDALRAAFSEMQARVAKAAPNVEIDGMLVEAMCKKGLELVVGATRDPGWGPVLMIGLGGIMVEAIKDVRLIAPDLSEEDIVAELRQLKSAPLLGSFRGAPAPDVPAIAKAIAAVGRLMLTRPDIAEIDINPLLALPQGQGVVALDALVVTK